MDLFDEYLLLCFAMTVLGSKMSLCLLLIVSFAMYTILAVLPHGCPLSLIFCSF